MTRFFSVLWFFFAVTLHFLVGTVQAETISASSGSAEPSPALWQNIYGYTDGYKSTPQATCDAGVAWYSGGQATANPVVLVTKIKYNCTSSMGNFGSIDAKQPICVTGMTYNPTSQMCEGGYVCPPGQNWTLSGSICTRPDCDLGYDHNSSGQCVKDCTGKAGMDTTNSNYSFTGASSTWSVSGCKVTCAQRVITAYGGGGYGCKYSGASADPEAVSGDPKPPDPEKLPPEKPEDCLNAGSGYVQTSSGVKCVPSESAPEGQKPGKVESDSKKESGTPGADGKPDPNAADYKKEDSTTTRNSDGTTTTTKKETVNGTPDGNGGTTCPSGYTANGTKCERSSSTSTDTKKFCTDNPNDPTCKGTQAGECDENPDRLGCKKLGDPTGEDGGDLTEQEVSPLAISPVAMSEANSCPSGTELPHGLGTFNWTPICDYANAFKPLIILFAWISAAMIVFGWKK